MSTQDHLDHPSGDAFEDRTRVMAGIDHENTVVVPEQPDIVVHGNGFFSKCEEPGRVHSIDSHSEHHDRPQDFSALHLVERFLDAFQGDGLGVKRVEIETALHVEVDQHRKIPCGEGVAVP